MSHKASNAMTETMTQETDALLLAKKNKDLPVSEETLIQTLIHVRLMLLLLMFAATEKKKVLKNAMTETQNQETDALQLAK